MGVPQAHNMSMHKPCLGCAFGWGLLAVILVCVALGTDFWYLVDYETENATSASYSAIAYGVVQVCSYSSTSDWTINTGDSGWSCSKWDDSTVDSDCKEAAANGLAWGLMGLMATAPAAVLVLFTCCCADKCMGNCCGKFMSFLTFGCLLFATIAFMIAPAVLAGQCKDENEAVAKLLTNNEKDEMIMHYSFYCCMSAIFAALISLCCYLTFFCTKPNEDCEDGHANQNNQHAEFKNGEQA